MRRLRFISTVIMLVMFVSCCREITEERMKKEIKAWWGMGGIDDVIIEDYLEQDTLLMVLSRLVVAGDTIVRMSYEFKKCKFGWGVSKGPVDNSVKELCIQDMLGSPIQMARASVIKANMRSLHSVLQIIYVETITFPTYLINEDSEMNERVSQFLRGGMKNPYSPHEQPFIGALGDTSEWFPDYIGKVIYFPWIQKDGTTSGYVIRGSTGIGFIDLVFVVGVGYGW